MLSHRLARLLSTGALSGLMALPALATPLAVSDSRASHGEVTIYRDAMGVPHIVGTTSAEVMYGLGYAMAQDRLAQLELARRSAQGRQAELLGPSAVPTDITGRDRMLPRGELLRMYRAIPVEYQQMMRSYVDGINRQISEINRNPARKTPYEFTQWGIRPEPWTLLDLLDEIVALPKGRDSYELQNLAFLNAMIARHGEVAGRRIFEDVVPISDPDSPTTIPPGEDLAPAQPIPKPGPYPVNQIVATAGSLPAAPAHLPAAASRCLVIGPKRSASGHVLMLEATADGPEAQLYGGGFDAAGFSVGGWGLPTMGRARSHGWLLSSGVADTTTTYAERLDPANRYRYWFKGAYRQMRHRLEIIKVKGGSPVTHEVAITVHGPVIEWDVAHGVAYTQRYAERGRELENWVAFAQMARASSIQEFERQAVARLSWNLQVCYGDTSGQIAFWEAGSMPRLPSGVDPRLPTPGTGEYEWRGFLSPNEYPHMRNPKQGYFHTWNSKVTTWSREGDDARIGKTFRTWLGNELAAGNDSMTLLDMQEVNRKLFNAMGARDRTNTSPAFFAPYVRAAVAHADDTEVRRAAALMLSFNGRYEDLNGDGLYDNPGLTIFRTWLQVAPRVIFGPDMGDWWKRVDADRYLKYQTSLLLRALQGKAAGLPLKYDYFHGRDHDEVIVQTIRETIDQLKPRFPGKDMVDWRLPAFWKYLDPARRTARQPALPGEIDTPRTAAVLGLEPYAVRHNGGEEWVGLMELTSRHPVLYSVVEAGGQDLFIDPRGKGNPHLADQVMMHAHGELKRIDMSIPDVKRDAVSVTHLRF